MIRPRRLAESALAAYGLPDARLQFIAQGENTTFKVYDESDRYLLRLHRPARHGRDADSTAAVRSELAWLTAIRADTSVVVPEPVAAPDGALTVRVGDQVCSLLRWLDGRIRERSARPVHLRRLGDAMARLHDHTESWTPPPGFTRIRWDWETFFGDVMVYGGVPAGQVWDLLAPDVRRSFEKVAARMEPVMAGLDDVALIHADLHLGNAAFDDGGVRLIDFDDCGTGNRIYDVAVALWELRHRPDYPAYRDALLAGYRARRPIDTTRLDDFIALREVAFGLWYAGTAQVDPAFREDVDETLAYCADSIDKLLP
jgi:Ser/Thr protein kinase RdoA (MazF antagonist)